MKNQRRREIDDIKLFLRLAPIVTEAVRQRLFDPAWMNSVIRLEWIIAQNPELWETAYKDSKLNSSTLSQWRGGRTEIPVKCTGNRIKSLTALHGILQLMYSQEEVTMPWLLGLDRFKKHYDTVAKRLMWAIRLRCNGTSNTRQDLIDAAAVIDQSDHSHGKNAAEIRIREYLEETPSTLDPQWLKTGWVTEPAFAKSNGTVVTEKIPDFSITMDRMEVICLLAQIDGCPKDWIAGFSHDDPVIRLRQALDAMPEPAAAPYKEKVSFLHSWQECFSMVLCNPDLKGRTRKSIQVNRSTELRALTANDLCDGLTIFSSDLERVFRVNTKARQ